MNFVHVFHQVSPTPAAPRYVTFSKPEATLAWMKAPPVAAGEDALEGLKSGAV